MGESDNSKPSWLGETVIALAIPIIGYAFAFISELAYFNYFKMPIDLIEMTFSNLLARRKNPWRQKHADGCKEMLTICHAYLMVCD